MSCSRHRARLEHLVTCLGIADDLDRVAALDPALDTLAREHLHGNGRMRWVYLLLTARRAG